MNKKVISIIAAYNSGLLRRICVSPYKSAARKKKSPLSSAAIIIFLLFITFFTECVAQPDEGRRQYSMTELKRYKWVNLEYYEGRQYSKWIVYYTDTEAISVHTYQNRKGETNTAPTSIRRIKK